MNALGSLCILGVAAAALIAALACALAAKRARARARALRAELLQARSREEVLHRRLEERERESPGSARDVLARQSEELAAQKAAALNLAEDAEAARIKAEQAEQRIRESLLEKESLLKEIHHRVKNNLQIISSLLRLQATQVKNQDDSAMLRESEERVNSMSLIHEMLYQSKDLARVDFSEYVRNLASELLQSYQADPGRIALHLEVEDVALDVEHAIPMGLILNELVSNTLKYAFPQGREGSLTISLVSLPGAVAMEVRDDGAGLPSDFEERRKTSLGLQIVDSLCKQLGGEYEFKNGASAGGNATGTRFRLRIKD